MQRIVARIKRTWYHAAVALAVFLLPWQARWIFVPGEWHGAAWEPLTESVYVVEIMLWIVVGAGLWRTRHACSSVSGALTAMAFIGFASLVFAGNAVIAQQAFLRLLVAIFFAVIISRDRSLLRGIAWAILWAAVLQSVVAVMQSVRQDIPASTLLGMSAQDPGVSGVSVVAAFGGRFLRAYGTFPHPNMLGGFLAMSLFVVFWLAIDMPKRSSRMILAAAATVIPWAIVLSFSRSAWVASAIIVTVVALALAMERWENIAGVYRRSLGWLWLTAIVVFNFLVAGTFYRQPVETRITGNAFLENYSLAQREVATERAYALLPDAWIHGVGPGNAVLNVAEDPRLPRPPEPLHNVFGLIWLELGLFGVALFAWLWVSAMRRAWRKIKHPKKYMHQSGVLLLGGALALGVLLFFDHYLWTQFSGMVFLWTMIAFLHA